MPDKRSASGSFAFVSSLKRRSYAAFVGINRRMQGSRRIWQTSSLTHPDNSPTDNHAQQLHISTTLMSALPAPLTVGNSKHSDG